ncbi:MAG TPA: hypothetical protein DCL48_02235 [Alphaproteobacteria bacterium]|nr:hypothetical protein [Alphaproteobacteria bacterium]
MVLLRGLVIAAVLAAGPSALAAEAVGQASSLRPAAMQKPPGAAQAQIAWKDQIYRDAELATAANGALEVTFADSSKLAMGPNSEMIVDEFTYAGPGSPSQQVVKYTKGAFRFISGAVQKDRVQLKTPTATVGIRGTVVLTKVEPDGTTFVGVEKGEATVTSTVTGQNVNLTAGEKVTIKPGGEIGGITLGKVEGCPG